MDDKQQIEALSRRVDALSSLLTDAVDRIQKMEQWAAAKNHGIAGFDTTPATDDLPPFEQQNSPSPEPNEQDTTQIETESVTTNAS